MNSGYVTIIGKLNKYYVDKNTGEKHFNYYLVQFEDGYIAETEYRALRHGKIKNPNTPSVYGVGFIGEGIYSSGTSKKHTKEYETWKKMLQRCYDEKYQRLEPSYIGVLVDKRWHNFQNFCEDIKEIQNYNLWLLQNGYELDKDILCERYGINPKIYSKDTCVFIEKKLNSIASGNGKVTGNVAVRLSDGYEECFVCIADFSKKFGLNPSAISGCLKGKHKTHKGWMFRKKGRKEK